MATARKQKAKPAITRREFFGEVAEQLRALLPDERQGFESRHTMNLMKVHYGANYRIHYEVWINTEKQYVELGLHFEDGPASTERLLRHFDRHILEIKDLLGVEVELSAGRSRGAISSSCTRWSRSANPSRRGWLPGWPGTSACCSRSSTRPTSWVSRHASPAPAPSTSASGGAAGTSAATAPSPPPRRR